MGLARMDDSPVVPDICAFFGAFCVLYDLNLLQSFCRSLEMPNRTFNTYLRLDPSSMNIL
jgi:hypothetical protein